MSEVEAEGVAFGGHAFVDGAGVLDFLAIHFGEGDAGEAVADVLLVFGVDAFGVADVDGDGHGGVGELEGLRLELADFGAVAVVIVLECGELAEVEGEVGILPEGAPIVDEGGVEFWEEGVVAGDGFALVPEDALDGVGDDGGDHAVEHDGGIVLILDGVFLGPRICGALGGGGGFGLGGGGMGCRVWWKLATSLSNCSTMGLRLGSFSRASRRIQACAVLAP